MLTSMQKLKRVGNLKGFVLPRILIKCYGDGKSAIIEFQNSNIIKTLYLENGAIVFARSNQKRDRLGEYLVRNGLIRSESLVQASNSLIKTGNRLGRILVEMGEIKPKTLFRAVRAQVGEIVNSLFQWNDGFYRIQFELKPPEERITLEMTTPEIILQGVRNNVTRTSLAAMGVNEDTFLIVSSDPVYQDFTFNAEEKLIREFFKKPGTLRDLTRNCEKEGKSVPNDSFCRLLALGLLERVSEEKRRTKSHITDVWVWPAELTQDLEKMNKAFRFLFKYARMEGGSLGKNVAHKAMDAIRNHLSPLLDNIVPESDGTLDFSLIKDNAMVLPPTQRVSSLYRAANEYVYALFFELQKIVPELLHAQVLLELRSITKS